MPKPDDHSPGAQAEVLGIEFEAGVQSAEDAPEPRWLPIAVAGFGLAALVSLLLLSPGDPSGPEATVPLWLVELTAEPRDEQTIRMVDLDGLAREVQEPVYFETTRWPAWAGAPLRPFITVNSNIVFPSRGEIVVAELSTGDSTTIGPGTAVVDGAVPGEFWVVGRGERWVARHAITDVGAGERFRFDGIGRPVAAVTGGLIVLPRLDQSVGELAVWRPDTGLTPIDTGGLDLLGVAGEVVVFGGEGRLVRYDTSDGTSTEVGIDESLDLHQVALSPDGRTLALAQRHDVTSFGTIVVMDATSGATLNVLDGVMNREFVWTSPETLVTIEFEGRRYRVVEVDVVEGEVSRLTSLGYPWVYFAVA